MKNTFKKIICCVLIVIMCSSALSLISCTPKDADLQCAEYIFKRNPDFVEKYGKVDSVKKVGESIDSADKTERYVCCEITLKDGKVINCTAILELDTENKSVAPLSWKDGKYTGENAE
ncbi:MAG: hypothetical protein IJ445_06135 [Clostridia bacterium]|nr:hypothetical protein [Clostridia bacterium]